MNFLLCRRFDNFLRNHQSVVSGRWLLLIGYWLLTIGSSTTARFLAQLKYTTNDK
jgi:hypothetical protein